MALPLSSYITLNKSLKSDNQLPISGLREWVRIVSSSTPELPISGLYPVAWDSSGSFAIEGGRIFKRMSNRVWIISLFTSTMMVFFGPYNYFHQRIHRRGKYETLHVFFICCSHWWVWDFGTGKWKQWPRCIFGLVLFAVFLTHS